MHKVNIDELEFEFDADDPEGFRAGMKRFGQLLGAARTGVSVYELPPGQAICPYHYEYAEEEWLIVLEGSPTVRHPGGSETLRPWDVTCFPPGAEGAHMVRNDTGDTVRVLMFSDVIWPAATVYPDSDKIGVYPARGEVFVFKRGSAVDYFEGEVG